MVDRQLLERIDACRPGSDDLHDPGLEGLAEELSASLAKRDLYDRVQALDQAIGEATQDLPLPAGLSERLLARLAAEQVVSTADAAASDATTGAKTTQPSRRVWLGWSVGLAAAASVAGIAAIIALRPPTLTTANIVAEVLEYRDERLPDAPVERGLPIGYPLSRYVYRLPHTTWRPIYGFLNRSALNGVAYDMMYRGATATLYVVRGPVGQLRTAPERTGMGTGGVVVAAWQENGLLYVLVVDGDYRTYQTFIAPPASV